MKSRQPGLNRCRTVVVLGDYEEVLARRLQKELGQVGFHVSGYADAARNEEILYERLKSADVAVVMRERTPLRRSLIERLQNLDLIVSTGTNTSVIDLDAGVPVLGTRSMISAAVEHTWALILALARNIPEEAGRLRTGLWQQSVGVGLEGKTLGLLGLGRIGGRVANVARAFGMQIVAWSPNLTQERADAHGAQYLDINELFAVSDIVSLHLRLGSASRGVVNKHGLDAMKSHALLVNTARAGLIDEASILDTMQRGTIAGFAQDVFTEEPLPVDSPLRGLPNTILTPHLGYVTDDNIATFVADIVDDIHAFYTGETPRKITL